MDTPLKKARISRDITQEIAANAVGIRQGYLSRLENGEVTPSKRIGLKLARYFDIPLEDVLYLPPALGTATPGEAA